MCNLYCYLNNFITEIVKKLRIVLNGTSYHGAGAIQEIATAATGMDALTHAIEGYTTKAAWEMTDMFHIKAIELIKLISENLRGAVENTPEGREGMAMGQYIAGM